MAASDEERRLLGRAALAIMAVVLVCPWVWPRVLVGLPFALYLPGRALLLTLAPARAGRLEEAMLAVGLSMCLTVFIGFVLHVFGLITPFGWALSLGLCTLAACRFPHRDAAEEEPEAHRLPFTRRPRERSVVDVAVGTPLAPFSLSRKETKLLAAAAGLAGLAYLVAYSGAVGIVPFKYTEFWMLTDTDNPRTAIDIGVRSMEAKAEVYAIELRRDNQLVATWPEIDLQPGQTWTRSLPYSLEFSGAQMFEARLFKGRDHDRLYRRVWIKARG